MVPGRWDAVRQPNRKELKATQVLALPLDEASAKIRTGPPLDEDEDLDNDVWAGHIPLELKPSAPLPDPRGRDDLEVPEHVTRWHPRDRLSG